jgi:hypothetical membrane protein
VTVATTEESDRSDGLAAWLALGGLVGPILFVLAFTIAGWLRPGYSPIHKVVSDLGLGPTAWLVNGAALLNCLLLSAWVAAFLRHTRARLTAWSRWLSAALLELPPLGYAVAAFFTEAPATLTIHTMVGANLALVAPALAFFVTALALRRDERWRGWSVYSFAASLATLLLVAVTLWTFASGSQIAGLQGLTERALIVETLAWYVYAGWRIVRERQ